MSIKAVFESSFSFSNVLEIASSTLDHVNIVFCVACHVAFYQRLEPRGLGEAF